MVNVLGKGHVMNTTTESIPHPQQVVDLIKKLVPNMGKVTFELDSEYWIIDTCYQDHAITREETNEVYRELCKWVHEHESYKWVERYDDNDCAFDNIDHGLLIFSAQFGMGGSSISIAGMKI